MECFIRQVTNLQTEISSQMFFTQIKYILILCLVQFCGFIFCHKYILVDKNIVNMFSIYMLTKCGFHHKRCLISNTNYLVIILAYLCNGENQQWSCLTRRWGQRRHITPQWREPAMVMSHKTMGSAKAHNSSMAKLYPLLYLLVTIWNHPLSPCNDTSSINTNN